MNFKRSILLTLVLTLLAMTSLTNCSSGDKKEEPPAKKEDAKTSDAAKTASTVATNASRAAAGDCVGDT